MADPDRARKRHTLAFDNEAFESLAGIVQDFGSTLDFVQLLRAGLGQGVVGAVTANQQPARIAECGY